MGERRQSRLKLVHFFFQPTGGLPGTFEFSAGCRLLEQGGSRIDSPCGNVLCRDSHKACGIRQCGQVTLHECVPNIVQQGWRCCSKDTQKFREKFQVATNAGQCRCPVKNLWSLLHFASSFSSKPPFVSSIIQSAS